jgi:hypothetical protein
MAPRFAQTAIWLAVLLQACSVRATAFWTYTSRFQYARETDIYTYSTYVQTYEYTSMRRTIKPKVTPTVSAVSTSTYSYSDDDLMLVYEWYPESAVAESNLEATYDYDATTTTTTSEYSYTVFYMAVTYTAPSSCPTPFTYSTDESVYVPSEVREDIVPLSTTTGFSYVTWYLSAGDAPFTSTTEYYYSQYVKRCSNPYSDYNPYTTTTRSTSSNGGTSNNYSYGTYCGYYSGCNVLAIWIIVLAVILPTLFLLGFIESWFWFRRLMLGKGAMRFGTVCWICLSLWIGCFTRFQSRRSPDDQLLLKEKWKKMSSGTAFKLWWKWGFRHAYPTELLGTYSMNNSGVPAADGTIIGGAQPQMAYANGNGMPPPGPPPAFINHNGVIYVPQGQRDAYGPQPTSYINHSGVIYIPQTEGYTTPSTTQTFTPPPQQGFQPQAYPQQGYYAANATKEVPSTTTRDVSAPPTEVSSLAQSPQQSHVQPAMSEVSSVPDSQLGYVPPGEVEGHTAKTADQAEFVPPKHN